MLKDWSSLTQKETQFLLRIIEIQVDGYVRVLKTKCVYSEKEYNVKLEGFWSMTEVNVKNMIRLIDPCIKDNETLIVDSIKGLVIVEPNTLVSSTTLVQALFCKRKAVLSEKFRAPGTNIQMTLGNVCHELFQTVLRRRPKIVSPTWLLAEYRRSIFPQLILDFVILDISADSFEAQLKPYLTNITTWMKKYLPPPFGQNDKLSDGNQIADIEDIEMNIWSNGIGVKGKIDVALRTSKNRIIPLELKTGKSSASTDHQAQVLLYTMLLSEIQDGELDSGILLYLKDGIERIVTPKTADLKGILSTRNGMAAFSRELNIESFPDPRYDIYFCGKCPFSQHCTILQKFKQSDGISSEMQKFAECLTSHLSEKELAYGKQWLEWTFMEWKTDKKRKNMEIVFMESPKKREINGKGICNLVLENSESKKIDGVWLKFVKENNEILPTSVLEVNELVIISTNDAVALQYAVVTDRQRDSITIKTDKELPKRFSSDPFYIFHLDSYTSNASFPMHLNSIINFLDHSDEAKRLREFVIDLKEPTFGTLQKYHIEKIKPIVKKLSLPQAKAVVKALASNDYLLIQGFPGSGKTSTIVALVQCLVALGRSVLLTAYTNSAVDNMLLRLREVLPPESMLRIGGNYSTSRLEEIKPLLLDEKLAAFDNTKPVIDQAKNMLAKIPIVATTCLTAGSHVYFTWRTKFDYCIIDEAALALQSSTFKPLLLGQTYVLVGDCRQLEPLVVCKEAKEQGMNISLMERWEKTAENFGGLVKLNLQYRMNSKICELSSQIFYDGLLQCATDSIANQTIDDKTMNSENPMNFENLEPDLLPKDLLNLVLSSNLSDSVIFIDTLSRSSSNNFIQTISSTASKSNKGEVDLLSRLCKIYLAAGFSSQSIGAMSTYRNQVEELRKSLPSSIETNTVDQYQGRDKDIILLSLVYTSTSDSDYGNESLLSERRINVALTRAKKKLIIVGCYESLSNFPLVKQMIEKIGNVYKLSE